MVHVHWTLVLINANLLQKTRVTGYSFGLSTVRLRHLTSHLPRISRAVARQFLFLPPSLVVCCTQISERNRVHKGGSSHQYPLPPLATPTGGRGENGEHIHLAVCRMGKKEIHPDPNPRALRIPFQNSFSGSHHFLPPPTSSSRHLDQAVVQRQGGHDGLVPLAAFLELLHV
jgi:hypothetical protein